MEQECPDAQAGLSRRNLLAVLAGLAALGVAGLILGPGADSRGGGFDLKSWPVRTVEIKNFTFNPETATVIWREYNE